MGPALYMVSNRSSRAVYNNSVCALKDVQIHVQENNGRSVVALLHLDQMTNLVIFHFILRRFLKINNDPPLVCPIRSFAFHLYYSYVSLTCRSLI